MYVWPFRGALRDLEGEKTSVPPLLLLADRMGIRLFSGGSPAAKFFAAMKASGFMGWEARTPFRGLQRLQRLQRRSLNKVKKVSLQRPPKKVKKVSQSSRRQLKTLVDQAQVSSSLPIVDAGDLSPWERVHGMTSYIFSY